MVSVAARLRKLEAQATEGPWPADGERVLTNVGEAYPAGRAARCGRQADAEFIATSRSLWPLLADLAEAAERIPRTARTDRLGLHAALARVAELLDHEEGTP